MSINPNPKKHTIVHASCLTFFDDDYSRGVMGAPKIHKSEKAMYLCLIDTVLFECRSEWDKWWKNSSSAVKEKVKKYFDVELDEYKENLVLSLKDSCRNDDDEPGQAFVNVLDRCFNRAASYFAVTTTSGRLDLFD